MTTAQRKQQLRLDMKLLSSTIALEERERNSLEIVRKLSTVPAYVRSDLVLGFVPLASEPDLGPLYDAALADGKVVALPRCTDDGRMVFHAVGPNWRQQLLKGRLGIPEPVPSLDMLGELEQAGAVVVVVPALAFTPHRRRLGRGKGYYDRFIGANRMPDITCIGICFDYQIQVEIPMEEHDALVDLVVTESSVY
ncbi:MAG: 5-formyltetrahydrofolate cyclo-ligase [Sphaerochaeta sp.]|nr:5-formyltetrahydrofolate cyclo-ligase [Sphaerochaeta sp.]